MSHERHTWAGRPPVRRVAMLSAHTSPLDQPGDGDAGGMNVYVNALAERLAHQSVEVEVFTRATSADLPSSVEPVPGVRVRHVAAGPFEGLAKQDLPAELCAFVRDVLRVEAEHQPGYYDLVHSHYWLSGQVGTVVSERWGVPLVHSMHTMAKVKNAARASGDAAEPEGRIAGEQHLVDVADRLVANTDDEAGQLVRLYEADPGKVDVVHPGVDLQVFGIRDRVAARDRVGLPPRAHALLFAGRIQPLKAPDILLRAAAELVARDPDVREDLVVVVVGAPSGTGLEQPSALADLAGELGIADLVRFVPPVTQDELADWYCAASVVCVPSYNESFGLVALEAQACGTPVVAAEVGGLTTAVRGGGLLVPGHDPSAYAAAFEEVLRDSAARRAMSRAAVEHAAGFGWDQTARRMLDVYGEAVRLTSPRPRAVG